MVRVPVVPWYHGMLWCVSVATHHTWYGTCERTPLAPVSVVLLCTFVCYSVCRYCVRSSLNAHGLACFPFCMPVFHPYIPVHPCALLRPFLLATSLTLRVVHEYVHVYVRTYARGTRVFPLYIPVLHQCACLASTMVRTYVRTRVYTKSSSTMVLEYVPEYQATMQLRQQLMSSAIP
jgi:hypothetical protein